MNTPIDAAEPSPPLTNADRNAAHQLWTELHTRVATRPLPYRGGTEAGALDSLYALSQKIRRLIAKNPDANQFRLLALAVLEQLNSHLNAWHPRRDATGDIRLLQDRHRYRSELLSLQESLSALCDQLYVLAHQSAGPTHTPSGSAKANAGFGPGALAAVQAPDYPSGFQSESSVLNAEFQYLGLTERTEVCGLALSGGGIRSATFALGILQGLQARGLLGDFDYLSSVSGGGYLSGYLSGGIARLRKDPGLIDPGAEPTPKSSSEPPPEVADPEARARAAVFTGLSVPERDWVRWLRNNSKYLLNVSFRVPRIAALLIYGLFENTLTLVGLAMLAGLCVTLLTPLSFLPWLAAGLGTGVLSYTALRPFISSNLRERWWLDAAAVAVALLALGLLGIRAIDAIAEHIEALLIPSAGLGAFGSLFASAVAATHAYPKLSKILTPKLLNLAALVLGPLLVLLIAVLTHALMEGDCCNISALNMIRDRGDWLIPLFLSTTTTVILIRAYFVDVNQGGLRSFYRSQLRSCYGVTPNPDGPQAEVPLSTLPKKPFHIINMAINAPATMSPELRGRGCDFFSATALHCGSRLTGYQTTARIETLDSGFDLATAIATSGAAAASLMGRQSKPQFQFLMTLFNVRLGYWMRWATNNPLLRPNAYYLVREALGHVHATGNFINLSDGGHIENLAVYELLRRRVQFIVCIDGGCDPTMSCFDLIRLDRYARIDLDVSLDYDLKDLRPNTDGFCPSYGTMVRINYPGGHTGWMLYLKLAMTGTEPQVIQDYRKASPTFPHETTADQFFNEEQFEAYRMLGEQAVGYFFDRAFGTEQPCLKSPATTVPRWLTSLANQIGAKA
ncbi:hypothetical protein C7S18_22975 [Ahniella affigens]|uniref:PNPLA domain-containing protein n=1 Tax=Ahniella affigens TaxID=2021234 RepID=A0A2P1PYD9_9GAMM|nr:hypothetical protein [Ahniella affigens]AVP99862.1 hypothetical protein C7S18_22975 [Ahniella affigens]